MINERGIWTSEDETKTHLFDEFLCQIIAEVFKGQETVIDVGCGDGKYTEYLTQKGYKVWGYDGSPLTQDLTGGRCAIMDFSKPVKLGRYDLVLCLEVGEHIPKEYEPVFINNICGLSKNFIILSWAVIDQPGYGHVNCHNNEYVIDKMIDKGFKYIKSISDTLRKHSTLPWFQNTLMVFSRE